MKAAVKGSFIGVTIGIIFYIYIYVNNFFCKINICQSTPFLEKVYLFLIVVAIFTIAGAGLDFVADRWKKK